METVLDINFLVAIVMVTITASIVGLKWIKIGARGMKALKSDIQYWEEYATDLEKEVKKLKAKAATKDQPPMWKGEVTKENLPDLADQFFPMFADKLPSWARPFFKVPVIQKMAIKWAVENPDEAANLIGRFFKADQGRPKIINEGKQQLEEIPPEISIF